MTDVPPMRAVARIGGRLLPGFLVAAILALASQVIAERFGGPAMLMALLFGIAFNFLAADARFAPGISVTARHVLRIGVALLGLRISFGMVADLGLPVVGLVIGAVLATIAFGLLGARFFGFRYRFAFLSAGSVAICGASAAMAIAAILPRDDRSEERLVFTVVGVTVLSTLAMVLYPPLSAFLAFDDRTAGIFLGATIHDVAQVVGAGFSISDEAGETATLVKLLRVAMLAPVVVVAALVIRRAVSAAEVGDARPPPVPGFVLAFVAFATLNSFVALPAPVAEGASVLSRWLLLVAIAAVGMKTAPRDVLMAGRTAVGLIVAETVFLAVFVAVGLRLLHA